MTDTQSVMDWARTAATTAQRERRGPKTHHLLFLVFTLAAALPVAALGIWQARQSIVRETDAAGERDLQAARLLAGTIAHTVADLRNDFDQALSGGSAAQNVTGPGGPLASLDVIQICMLRGNGTVENCVPGLPGKGSLAPDSLPLAELRTLAGSADGQVGVTPLHFDRSLKRTVFYLVRRLSGDRLGVGVVGTDALQRLQHGFPVSQNGQAIVLDQSGRVIANPSTGWAAGVADLSGMPLVDELRHGVTGVVRYTTPNTDDEFVGGTALVPDVGWSVVISHPVGDLLDAAKLILAVTGGATVATVLFGALLSWAVARFITSPVRRVANTAGAILDGDGSAHVTEFGRMVPLEIRRLREAFSTMVDDLQRRNAELAAALTQAEAASRAKSQFLANMSHEIRTPLNGMLGMIELMRRTEVDAKQQHYLETATSSGEALLGLVNDLLDLSKIEAGKLELEKRPFRLAEIVHETADMFAEAARAKGLSLDAIVPETLNRTVVGDARRLAQVLTNLIGNAVKFTRTGGIAIHVTLVEDQLDSMVLRFQVSDTGVGIPEEKQASIFDAFAQADGSTTRKFGGTGLGLSIARQICALMGGELGVQSRVGVGSMFWFTVSLGRSLEQSPAQRETTPRPPAIPVERETLSSSMPRLVHSRSEPPAAPTIPDEEVVARVLMADDNAVNMELVRTMLESLKCRVTCTADGSEAVAAFRPGAFDLVLMDLQMPVMDGFEALNAIRAAEGTSGKRTPVLALTAHALDGDRIKSLDAGFDDHLTKPVSFIGLEATLTRWVEPKKPKRRGTGLLKVGR